MNYILKPSDEIEYLFRAVPTESAGSMSYYLAKRIITCPEYLDAVKFYLHGQGRQNSHTLSVESNENEDSPGQLSLQGLKVNQRFRQDLLENLQTAFPELFE